MKELIGVHTLSGLGQDSYTFILEIDNNSAIKLSKNPEFYVRSKYITIRHHFIREQITAGKITLQRIDTKNNLVDILTKSLSRLRFQELREKMGIREYLRRSEILDRGSIKNGY